MMYTLNAKLLLITYASIKLENLKYLENVPCGLINNRERKSQVRQHRFMSLLIGCSNLAALGKVLMGMSGLEKKDKEQYCSNSVTSVMSKLCVTPENCRLKDTNNGMKVYTLLIFYFFLSPELFLKILVILHNPQG